VPAPAAERCRHVPGGRAQAGPYRCQVPLARDPGGGWYAGVVAGQAEVSAALAAERAATLERLELLERDFAHIVEAAGQAGADDEHDPEGATIAFERQHVAALASQARAHLAQVDAAMRRLAQGSYGICQDCARPIPAARLAARPASTTCLSCATHR
jgi:RNA polymerase-binding transcription factor